MALKLDPLLITLADFKEFRDISQNIDPIRLDVYVREAQINEMRALLSDQLYLVLINDYDPELLVFSEERFTDLWYGVDYEPVSNKTIRYYGLKPAIIYYAYSRFIRNQQMNVTRYGVKHITADQSEDETQAQIRTKINTAESTGNIYRDGFKKFISYQGADYPEYEITLENAEERTGFRFTQLSPRSKYDFYRNRYNYDF